MDTPTRSFAEIHQLAAHELLGALVVAEAAVDRHADQFAIKADKLSALSALPCDLLRLEDDRPELGAFLRRVRSYIDHIWDGLHAG